MAFCFCQSAIGGYRRVLLLPGSRGVPAGLTWERQMEEDETKAERGNLKLELSVHQENVGYTPNPEPRGTRMDGSSVGRVNRKPSSRVCSTH